MRNSILNKLILLLCLALVLGSCSESAPKISQTFWQLNLVHDQKTGKDTQALTIFVMASDDDGVDDMDKMYVINDEHQLYWEISGKNLRVEKYGENEVWMGSNFITMPAPEEPLPGGTYRIMLLDSSGERAKTSVVISNNIKGAPDKWPTLTKMGDSVRIEGKADYVWGIQADGTFGAEFQANTGTVSTGSRRFSWYYLYSYLPDKGYGIINGPF
ncbi:MAG: hypothetical protein J6U56_05895 [Spirochaetia bacterium]|nr:hypothetical protein [Spirochaetia bacterium]